MVALMFIVSASFLCMISGEERGNQMRGSRDLPPEIVKRGTMHIFIGRIDMYDLSLVCVP
jgi:hypothetical protein